MKSYKKILSQLKDKKISRQKFLKHSAPKKRSCGFTTKKCTYCGKSRAHMSQYGVNFCRQCFRKYATKIGFKRYS